MNLTAQMQIHPFHAAKPLPLGQGRHQPWGTACPTGRPGRVPDGAELDVRSGEAAPDVHMP